MNRGLLPLLIFGLLIPLKPFCQSYTAAEWLHTLNANAIRSGGEKMYEKAPAGFALYFVQAGDVRVPYIVYVPKSYEPSKPASMVVFLHGAILARDSFQYKDPAISTEPIFSIADVLNTIVVFPFARADFAWGRNEAANQNIMSIIAGVEQTYRINKARIYIGGISMGGNATYWFVENKASTFAGFYAFSSLPGSGRAGHMLANITPKRPLYTMNAKDDQVFPFKEVAAVYDEQKKAVPGWHFNTVESGGHRFIYNGETGRIYVKQLLGQLLASQER